MSRPAGFHLSEAAKQKLSEHFRGDSHPRAKLTVKAVEKIRFSYRPYKITRKMLAVKFSVSPFTVKAALSGQNWDHVAVQKAHSRPLIGRSIVSEEIVRRIWAAHKSGRDQKSIAASVGLAHSTVNAIVKGNSWRKIFEEMTCS